MTNYFQPPKNYINKIDWRSKSLLPLIIILICAGILGLFYLFQMNNLIISCYELETFKEKLVITEAEHKDLELKLVDLKSPGHLKKLVENFNLVEIESVTYLRARQEVVSVK